MICGPTRFRVTEIDMAPDDLPIDSATDDSTKSPQTKPPAQPGPGHSIGAEAEVRGGHEEVPSPPLEQLERTDRTRGKTPPP